MAIHHTNSSFGIEQITTKPLRIKSGVLNWLGELIGGWVYELIKLSPEDCVRLQQLNQNGTVVYVAQNKSHISLLHQLYTLSQMELPQPGWISGTPDLGICSLDRFLNNLDKLSRGNELRNSINWGVWPALDDILAYRSLKAGEPVSLCLNSAYQGLKEPWPYFQELIPLIKAQGSSEKPLFLVPYLLLSSIQPPKQQVGFFKRLLGNGLFDTARDFFNLLLPEGDQFARARLGDPLNLKEWLACQPANLPQEEICGRLYCELRQRFLDQERVAIGPRKPPRTDALHAILQDPKVLAAAGITAETPLKDRHIFELKTQKIVNEVAANYNGRFLRFFCYLIESIISKIYDDVIIDRDSLHNVALAASKGPLIICPSHKSHVDYLIASVMLLRSGLTPPHIAAGVNLSFWPLGPIFRRAGAFFIRRTFKGDKFYAAVFKSYVRYLLANGYSIEFFMEGGRSRTGKLLMPKLGMMNMILEAWREEGFPEVHVVPLSIDYERIVEVGSYTKELAGGEKKPESIKGLLASGRFLSLNCGRIYMNFAQPIRLRDYLEEQCRHFETVGHPEQLSDDNWRTINKRLSYNTLYNVGTAVTVTPTALVALVMLSHESRTFTREQLNYRLEFFCKILYSCGIKFSPLLENQLSASIEAVLDNLLSSGKIERESHHRTVKTPVYKLSETAPIELDFYKNNIMQQLAPLAISAAAILHTMTENDQADLLSYSQVKEHVEFLSQLFKNEFLFAPVPDGLNNFDIALTYLAAHGIVSVTAENQIKVERKNQLKWLNATLDCFVEAYWAVVSNLSKLRSFPLWQGEFGKQCLEDCRSRFTRGLLIYAEAASKILINNALNWLIEAGYLTKEGPDPNPNKRPLVLAITEAQEEELLNKLKAFLPQYRQ